jgi:phosphodiesterase/alkaline phosphatase D-like protein
MKSPHQILGLASFVLMTGAPGQQFSHGVASGDPAADSVVLWTRLGATDSAPHDVDWEISRDQSFSDVVGTGTFTTGPDRDYTVKVVAGNLESGTTYFYRFAAPDSTLSETGVTRTLPGAEAEQVRFAVFSCANITSDHFSAYAKAAENGDYDALVHLGDSLYEYAEGGYSQAENRVDELENPFQPARELVTLGDYRTRYAQYAGDPNWQALRASAPLIMMWDDHETANDSYATGAENHTEGPELAPSTIHVTEGYFSSPFYTFARDAGGTEVLDLTELVFSPGETYTFVVSDLGIHPFYVSDSGYREASTQLQLEGDGNPTAGVSGGQFQMTIPDDFDGTISYYCAIHASMDADFVLRSTGEGSWDNRVQRALQVYFEWNPVRDPANVEDRKSNYRSFDFGDLVSLHMVETRLSGRDEQLAYPGAAEIGARIGEILGGNELATYAEAHPSVEAAGGDPAALQGALAPIVTNELFVAKITEAYTSPNQEMLGATQLAWLQNEIATSSATWQLLGSQTLMTNMTLPAEILVVLATGGSDLSAVATYGTPILKLAAGIPLTPEEEAAYQLGLATTGPYNLDAWDGYGYEREVILGTAAQTGKKLISIAGDTHNAWAGELKTLSNDTTVGLEFATPGVTAPGIERFFPGQEAAIAALFQGYSDNLYSDLTRRGFLDLTFTSQDVQARFYLEDTSTEIADWFVQTMSSTDGLSLSLGDEAPIDTDGDLLRDYVELTQFGSDPTLKDTDSDGLNDNVEASLSEFGFSLTTPDDAPARLASLYTADQLRALAIQPAIETGNDGLMTLKLKVRESDDLKNFFDFPVNQDALTIDEDGRIIFRFTPSGDTKFYQLRAE